ncbi:MAG: 2-amino-4-hydroxy-6-hydroxymethyldihydropteridine diphosphokinase [Fimbriimonadaceae bacterium]|nr:2-amino-4-hydroxy-6-hydroxymethyldihydropteridine diphosphokinase [Fimbriimonadaceae bacterium]
MTPVAIALGSNLGDRLAHLREAVSLLGQAICLERVSLAYETPPMYVEDQPPYLNAAVTGETDLGPLALIAFLKSTEHRIGRTPHQRFGPREIDLDLIAYGRLRIRSRGSIPLHVPHPRLPERRFVLEPLAEIAPGLGLPGLGSVSELLGSPTVRAQGCEPFAQIAPR